MADDQRHVLDIEKQDQMADVKQNLPTSIRENLVATAVTFLQNPKVRQSAFAQRKTFLERKGLTADEISLAIQRSGTADDENAAAAAAAVDRSSAVVPMRPSEYPVPQISAWTKVREVASSVVLLTGAAYGLYHFYKEYVAPALFGKGSKKEQGFDKLEKTIDDLQKNMADVITNMIELQRQLTINNEQVLSAVRSSAALRGNLDPGLMNVSDLKDEIKSVKSLLLSRNQFPPTPALAPVIPAWQLQQQQQSAFEPTTRPSGEAAASGTDATQPVSITEDSQDAQNDADKSKDNNRPNDVDDLQLIANKANSEPMDLEKNGKNPVPDSSENQAAKSSSVLNGGNLHIKTV